MPFPSDVNGVGLGLQSVKTSSNDDTVGGSSQNLSVQGGVTCTSLAVPTLNVSSTFTGSPARVPQNKAYSIFVYPSPPGTTLTLTPASFPTRLPIICVLNLVGYDPGSNLISMPFFGWYLIDIISSGDPTSGSNEIVAYRCRNTNTGVTLNAQNHEIGVSVDAVYPRRVFRMQYLVPNTSANDRFEIQYKASTNITTYFCQVTVICLTSTQS